MYISTLSEGMIDFLEILLKNQVEFLVCGGHAVGFHGYPRMTMDFDLLVKPSEENAKNLLVALSEFGFGNVPELSKEVFCKRGTAFTLGVQPNQIDLLTSVSSQEESEIFANCVSGVLAGIELKIISFDDLMRAKKEAGRLIDQLDFAELTNQTI